MSMGIFEIVCFAVATALAVVGHLVIRSALGEENSRKAFLIYCVPLCLAVAAIVTPPDVISMLVAAMVLLAVCGVAVLGYSMIHRAKPTQ